MITTLSKRGKSVFLALIFLLPVSKAYPWGAVFYFAPTHQVILNEAYNMLSKDPAFEKSGFLTRKNILVHEGVGSWVDYKLDPFTMGNGPDVDGASPYSWHYYNPVTKEGMADYAVNLFYKELVDPKNSGDKSKPAAWSAHFLADMSVPYHIVGMTAKEVADFQKNNTQFLSKDITGPLELYDDDAAGEMPPAGWGEDRIFGFAMKNFMNDHAGGDVDWFDPWYSNGSGARNSHEVVTSSHVLWEGDAHKKYAKNPFKGSIPNEPDWYNPAWKNADPDFAFNENIAANQADQAALFTRTVAMQTRKKILEIHKNPPLGVYHAIRNVATVWRASITGLKPSLHYSCSKKKEGVTTFECRVRNGADDVAGSVHVRFFLQKNSVLLYEQIKSVGDIFSGGTGSARYTVELKPDTEYVVGMAVAGKYDVPDLQYATATGTLKTKPVEDDSNNWLGTWHVESYHEEGPAKGRSFPSTMIVKISPEGDQNVVFAGKTWPCRFSGNTLTFTGKHPEGGTLHWTFVRKGNELIREKSTFNGKINVTNASGVYKGSKR